MAKYANGKYAFGFCDRTGFRYKLSDLVPEFRAGRLGDYTDPQQIQNSRPDSTQDESRRLFAFDPVGNGNGNGDGNIKAVSSVGTVTVTIS